MRTDTGGGPSLEQIRSLVNPVAAAARQAAMRDGGYQPPAVLPNPLPTAPEQTAKPTEQTPAITDPADYVPDLNAPEDIPADKTGEKIEEPTESPIDSEDKTEDIDDLPEDPKAENFKNLRTIVKSTKAELQAAKAEADKLRREVEAYKTGEAVPEVIKEKEERIAQLEPLEHLHALRTSKLYHEKYIQPLESLQGKLKSLAKEYEISDEEMAEAGQCETQAELNRWLSEHFDPLGAQDARDILRQIHGLHTEAARAEAEPRDALNTIIQEAKAAEQSRQQAQLQSVDRASRLGWVAALEGHKAEGILPELVLQEGNEAHNSQFVRPILTKAGADYAKIVKKLFENGLRELPHDLAYALASACQKAHATSVRGSIHDAALKHAEELAADARAGRRFSRPVVGGSSGMAPQPAAAAERMTPEQAAKLSREKAAATTRK